MDELKYQIKDRHGVRKLKDGWIVTIYDPDTPSMPMKEYYFAKIRGKYDLVFRTFYYKLFNAKIYPPLQYSVYCKKTTNPVVAEFVNTLLKLVKQ